MSGAIIRPATTWPCGYLSIQRSSGVSAVATNEARETIRLRAKVARKKSSASRIACGARPRNTPRPVATPLPPENPRKGEKRCPSSAATAVQTSAVSPRFRKRTATTGTQPLATSPSKVSRPAFVPALRATLVAPILPLPAWRIATPRRRAMSTPVGIEPHK